MRALRMTFAARALVACAAVALGACVRSETLPFDLEASPGDLVIVATKKGATLERVDHFLAGEPRPPISVSADATSIAFVIPRSALVDSLAAPLDDAMYAGLVVTGPQAKLPERTCGRCLNPAPMPPQIVHPGDVCAVPAFARGVSKAEDAALIPTVAAELRLTWPGACPCAPTDLSRPVGPLQWSLGDGLVGTWPHRIAAGTRAGAAALFAEHHAIAFRSWTSDSRSGERDEGSVFPSEVLAASGAREWFVVSSVAPGVPPPGAILQVLDVNLQVQVPSFDLGHRAAAMHETPNGELLLLGEGPLREAKAQLCTVSPELDCAPLNINGLAYVGRSMLGALTLVDGAWMFFGDHGLVVLEREVTRSEVGGLTREPATEPLSDRGTLTVNPSGERVAWRAFHTDRFEADGAPLADLYALRYAARLGERRVLFCATGLSGARLFLTELGREQASLPAQPFTAIYTSARECSGLSLVPGGSSVRATFTDGSSAVVAEDGRVLQTQAGYQPPGLDVPASSIVSLPQGVTIATTLSGASYARDDVGNAELFTRLYGNPGASSPVVGFLEHPDATQALFESGELRDVRGASGWFRVQGTLPSGIAAGSVDSRARELVLSGTDGQGAWLMRASLNDGVQPTLTGDRFGTELGSAVLRALEEVVPGVHVVVTNNGRLFRLEGRTLTAVPIDWDDPYSVAIEEPPDPRAECQFVLPTGADTLRGATVSLGATWVVGCQGVVLAAYLVGPEPRAIRFTLERSSQTVLEAPMRAIFAASATCPDDVLIAADDMGARDRRGFLWQLTNRTSGCTEPWAGLCPFDADVTRAGRSASYSGIRAPVRIARGSARAVVAHETGVRSVEGDDPYRMDDYPRAVVALPDGTFVLGSAQGRFWIGAP